MRGRLKSLIGHIHPRSAVVAHDLIMVWVAWSCAYLVRYAFWPGSPELSLMSLEIGIVLVAQGLVMWWFGLYRGLWRFASVPDLLNILKAGIFGTLVVMLALFLFKRLEGVPRTVFMLYPVVLVFLLGTPRLLYRFWKDNRLDLSANAQQQRVLVLGAGRSGEMLVRDMRREGLYLPVGLLDDDDKLRGAKIHGVPVLGTIDDVARIAARTAAEIIVIAMPSASNQQMQRVVASCEGSDLPFQTLPRLQDMVTGRARFGDLKEVVIEDLLGRDPVILDWSSIRAGSAGRSVLVTGGGGSIGAELCRQLARLKPSALIVFDNSEFNLYRIDLELRAAFPELDFHAVLGDLCDPAAVERVVAMHQPDVVFHAAAYKHVPLLQSHLREACKNNVVGTRLLAQAAVRHAVGSFVLISTDKAVNPANLMGASKRAAEILCQNYNAHSDTRFVTVRFGNVLDSAGSVVPLFREQIAAGGPVTVTHPEITRYFMTIPEACQLILQAAVMGQGGEIFVLDMGEPVSIRYLAEQMIRLAGKQPEEDVAIVFTGLRPGEKLFEELFHEHEQYRGTRHEQILLARHRRLDWHDLNDQLDALAAAVTQYDEVTLRSCLGQLVPELRDAEKTAADNVISISRRQA